MKQEYPEGFWVDDKGNMGFTSDHLAKVGTIWTIAPRKSNELIRGGIFANIESSKCLGPLRSPVAGTIVAWEGLVLDQPDTITAETTLLRIKTK